MTPVYQTRTEPPHGNCFAACVASILDRRIEDVDVDVSNVRTFAGLRALIEAKANCKIYYANHEAIQDGFFKTAERFCFIEVCTFIFNGDPDHANSVWHVVVGEVDNTGKLSVLFNPEKGDHRKCLDQFVLVRKILFVKANPNS